MLGYAAKDMEGVLDRVSGFSLGSPQSLHVPCLVTMARYELAAGPLVPVSQIQSRELYRQNPDTLKGQLIY